MKKEIIQEVLRMKLLSKYDNKSTLTENKEVIFENKIEAVAGAVRTADDIARIERDLLKTSGKELSSALEAGSQLKKLTVNTTKGVALRTTEEIMSALRKGLLSPSEAGRVYWTAFRNSNDPKLLIAISDRMMGSKSFVKQYGSLNKEAFIRMIQKDFKIGPKQAESLWKANGRRLSSIVKDVEAGVETGAKVGKDLGQSGKEIGQGSKNVDKSINITIDMGGGQRKVLKNGNEYVRYLDDEAEAFGRTYGKDFDDLARNNGHDNFKKWMAVDQEGAMRSIANDGKKGKGAFSRIINWGKRRLKWRILWSLAKIAGISWLAWYLFFKKDGFEVECDEGTHFEEGKGCIPDKITGGGDEGGGDNVDNTKVITDNEGNKYKECVDIYYKGCVNKKGNTDIKEAQNCLGVTPNGFFNQETEDALYKKINKRSFSASDLPNICARSYGGGSFQI
jgi:hypothetical protein